MLVSIKNTFLDAECLDAAASMRCFVHRSRRTKSADPVLQREQKLTSLQQANLDSLNALLRCSHLRDSPEEQLQEQAPVVKKDLSNSSLSTSCSEDLHCHNIGRSRIVEKSVKRILENSKVLLKQVQSHAMRSEFCMCSSDTVSEEESCSRCTGEHSDNSIRKLSFGYSEQSCRSVAPMKTLTHGRKPKATNLVEQFSKTQMHVPPTTMMLLSIPIRYTQQELIQEIEALGFADSFDFFYAPYNFSTKSNVGYAFVNFVSPEWAMRCQKDIDGYVFKKHQPKTRQKVTHVEVAHLQGFAANLRHYENAAVTVRGRSKRCGPVIKTRRASVITEAPSKADS